MCTEIAFATGRDPIVTVGGRNGSFLGGDGGQWRLPVAEVNRLIRTGRWSFFVNRSTASPPDRVAVLPVDANFLRTEADGEVPNNLHALPSQADDVPERPPSFPANLAPAREPEFFGIASARNGNFVATPDSDGLFRVLPSEYVNVRLEAPFSGLFQVLVAGDGPLYQASTGTWRLPDGLEQRGWWAFESMGYWGRDPGTMSGLTLERDRTRYQLRIRLPDAVLERPLVSILIAQRSLNPNCPVPENLSSYLDLAVARIRSQGGPAVGTSPPPPTAGVERIGTWIQDRVDQFTFRTTVINPLLNGATITTVTNTATDKDRRPVRLVNVTHRDEAGAQMTDELARGGSSGAYAGLGVKGEWSLRVTDLSAVFLDSRRVSLDVAWRKA